MVSHSRKIYVKSFSLTFKVKVITGPLIQTVKRCLTMATSGARGRESLTVLLERAALEELVAQRQEMEVGAPKMQRLTFQLHLRELQPLPPPLA